MIYDFISTERKLILNVLEKYSLDNQIIMIWNTIAYKHLLYYLYIYGELISYTTAASEACTLR